MKIEKRPVVLAIVSSLIFGLSITLNKYFLSTMNATPFLGTRFFFISIICLGFLLIRKRLDFGRFDKVQWLYIVGISGLWFVFSMLFFSGLKLNLPSHGIFFYLGFPVITILLRILFFKGKVSQKEFFFMTIWIIGVILVFFLNMEKTILWDLFAGNILILLSVLALGFGSIIYKKSMIKDDDRFMVLFLKYSICFGLSVVFLTTFGKSQLSGFSPMGVLFGFLSSIMMGASVFLWGYSSALVESRKIIFVLFLSPLATFLSSVLIFKEPISLMQTTGYFLILLSFWLLFRKSAGKIELFDV